MLRATKMRRSTEPLSTPGWTEPRRSYKGGPRCRCKQPHPTSRGRNEAGGHFQQDPRRIEIARNRPDEACGHLLWPARPAMTAALDAGQHGLANHRKACRGRWPVPGAECERTRPRQPKLPGPPSAEEVSLWTCADRVDKPPADWRMRATSLFRSWFKRHQVLGGQLALGLGSSQESRLAQQRLRALGQGTF
jgi:hypothetical protein